MSKFSWECTFLIWTIALDELNKFITQVNQVHPSMKFAFSYSSKSVNFSDTTVKESPTGEPLTRYLKRKQNVKPIFAENQNTCSL